MEAKNPLLVHDSYSSFGLSLPFMFLLCITLEIKPLHGIYEEKCLQSPKEVIIKIVYGFPQLFFS